MTDERRQALVELGQAMRELNRVTVLNESPIEDIRWASEQVTLVQAALGGSARASTELATVDDLSRGIRMFDPVVGHASPVAPEVVVDDAHDQSKSFRAHVTVPAYYDGHVGVLHGGYIALLLDHVVGTAAMARVWPVVTASLSVEFRRPVPSETRLLVCASITGTVGRRISVAATIATAAEPDVVLAEGTALIIELTAEQAIGMLGSPIRRVNGRAE